MLVRIMAAMAIISISGCAANQSSTAAAAPNGLMVATHHMFVGRPFKQLVMRYGQPVAVTTYGDLTVYAFQASGGMTAHAYELGYTAGSAAGAGAMDGGCTMRVAVDERNLVAAVDFTGRPAACAIFMP